MEKEYTDFNINSLGLKGASNNDWDALKIALSKGADNFHDMAKAAAEIGVYRMVRRIVDKAKTLDREMEINFNKVAVAGALSGSLKIVRFCIAHNAKNYEEMMVASNQSDNPELQDYILEKMHRESSNKRMLDLAGV